MYGDKMKCVEPEVVLKLGLVYDRVSILPV